LKSSFWTTRGRSFY